MFKFLRYISALLGSSYAVADNEPDRGGWISN